MASTLWIGSIHFGNTDIPVKLHTSVNQRRVQFHLFHKTDKVKLRQQMMCAFEKTPVSSDEQVKGYQFEERKYVIIDPEEIEQAEPHGDRSIDVHEFVKTGEIDPVFIERTYFLEPDFPQNSYFALAEALKDMNAEGVCTWVMRKRAYLGAVYSAQNSLRLKVLRYADEIIQPSSLGLESFSLPEKELEIGSELINRLTVPFDPAKYHNDHIDKLMTLIEMKANGGKFTPLKPKRLKSTEPDKLLAALEASLKAA